MSNARGVSRGGAWASLDLTHTLVRLSNCIDSHQHLHTCVEWTFFNYYEYVAVFVTNRTTSCYLALIDFFNHLRNRIKGNMAAILKYEHRWEPKLYRCGLKYTLSLVILPWWQLFSRLQILAHDFRIDYPTASHFHFGRTLLTAGRP